MMCQLNGMRSAAGGGRGHLSAGKKAQPRDADRRCCGNGRSRRQHAGEDGSAEYRDIGSSFHEAGTAKHFVTLQMLGQDRIFDWSEEGRMNPHETHCGEHQRNVRQHDAGAAENHDTDFGELNDSELRLVVIVGELTRQSREEKEGEDEQALRDRAELELLRWVREQLIGDEQHHRLLEQAVVERAKELGRE
jgi:hypothetical protein